jgi:hypothetical protein
MQGHHYEYRANWGHHRRGYFPLVPLLFIGFLLMGGWKLIFPLIMLGVVAMIFFKACGKPHHWHTRNWGQDWGKDWGHHWGWDDEKPKRKNGDSDEKRKNDDETIYI